MEDEIAQSCLVPGISVSFQKSYFYYTNWLSPLSMLLSVWCAVSNAAVIIALFRSGIKRLRPGLLMVCSLTFSDIIWGAYVSPLNAGFRIKHLLNTRVCEVYLELDDMPKDIPTAMYFLGTFGNLAIITIDRYLAVHSMVQYKYLVTRRPRLCRLLLGLDNNHNIRNRTASQWQPCGTLPCFRGCLRRPDYDSPSSSPPQQHYCGNDGGGWL